MGMIVHELSWSSSRAATFDECRRRYYHDYYLSWTGWSPGADPLRRRAWLLKKMTRLPMLAGEALHGALEAYFQGKQRGHVADERELVAQAVGQLRNGYKESRDGLWKRRPARMVHLAEHHYEEACIDESTTAAAEYGGRFVQRIQNGLRTFFEAPELAEARAVEPDAMLACEEMGTIELFGTKVFAIPDFAYRRATEAGAAPIRIYDWKSGSPRPADEFQLAVYVLYAGERWGAEPEDVECIDAYLPTGEFRALRFDRAATEQTMARIEESLSRMRAVHFDADAGVGDADAFPMIEEDDPRAARSCGGCHYRELCGRQ